MSIPPPPALPELRKVIAFQLTTRDPASLTRFYVEALGFEVLSRAALTAAQLSMLDLRGGGVRTTLRLGEQRVDLDTFDLAGKDHDREASSADLCFQHFAIVTSDIQAAWQRALARGAVPISRAPPGPVRLPARSGGVTAVKFRDPDGHPLELLAFPDEKAGWRGVGNLGIDHSAIGVRDAAAAVRWYTARGLKAGRASLNDGDTQAALDGLDTAVVDVVPMMPDSIGPHVELLGYRIPQGRAGPTLSANDVDATRILWRGTAEVLLRDPDGHLHLVEGD